jgi:phosphate-selective porin OprO/OprP
MQLSWKKIPSLYIHLLLLLGLVLGGHSKVIAQHYPITSSDKLNNTAIQYVSADSAFSVKFRFRMQTRVKYTSNSGDDLSVKEWEARVRRLRVRLEGHFVNPKLTYKVQLGFTRGDMDFSDSKHPYLVRNAIINYQISSGFKIGLGLDKLPGNRQRYISSGSQQFAERALVSGNFNIDEDFGLFATYSNKLGQMPIKLYGSISTGEGKVANTSDKGLAYTGRAEIFPFGKFTNEGDTFEGDLERESKPKLVMGGGYSFNDQAKRTQGQTGTYLYAPLDLKTTFLDLLFKYNGWAYQSEYMHLHTKNPVTTDGSGSVEYAYKGYGWNQQLSYLVHPNTGYELAGRYSLVRPHADIRNYEQPFEVFEVGVTKYLRAHRVKLQLNGHYYVQNGRFKTSNPSNHWGAIFQIELGI